MKVNTGKIREVSIVKFFNPSMTKWNPNTAPVVVRDVRTREMFTLYESQLKRIPLGKNDKGYEQAMWFYIEEKVKKNVTNKLFS